jgi:ribonuclease HII
VPGQATTPAAGRHVTALVAGFAGSARYGDAAMPTTTRTRRGPAPGVRHEQRWWTAGAVVVGVDEVGRGAWAGPVTVGAVVLPRHRRIYKLRDSKLLTPHEREHLAVRIRRYALAVGVGHASNEEIDRVGMSEALRRAARRALVALPLRADVCLLDGNWDFLAGFGDSVNETIVGGDGCCASIAAASIVAKVVRDRLMTDACPAYPAYRFSSNKGYPSPDHLDSLDRWGPSPLHRHSWRPILTRTTPRLPL